MTWAFVLLGSVLAGWLVAVSVNVRRHLTPWLVMYSVLPLRKWTEETVSIPGLGQLLLDPLIALFFIFLMGVKVLILRNNLQGSLRHISLSWLFVMLAFVSALVVGFQGSGVGIKMFARILFPVLVFALVVVEYRNEPRPGKIIDLYLVLGAVISVVVFALSRSNYSVIHWSAGVDRLSGLGSVADHAYLMGLLCILSYVRFRTSKNKLRYLALFAVFAAQLLMTVTRGAIGATFVAIICIELFGSRQQVTQKIAMIGIMGLVMVAATILYKPLNERIFATHYKDSSQSASTSQMLSKSFERSGRSDLWKYVFDRIFSDFHLATGYGVGRADIDIGEALGGMPHNEYLRILYELGLPGMLLFLACLMQLWVLARRIVKHVDPADLSPVVQCCVGIVVFYCFGALVDNMISKYKNVGVPLYLFAGLAVVWVGQLRRRILVAEKGD